jgi:hypothetical protein
MERCWRPDWNIAHASAPLKAELTTESAMPTPICPNGCGLDSRCSAAQAMPAAAMMIINPSKPAETYSAL